VIPPFSKPLGVFRSALRRRLEFDTRNMTIVFACAECGHLSSVHCAGKCHFKNCACSKVCVALAPSEFEVFRLAAKGMTVKEIASVPGRIRSTKTVEAQLCAVNAKLGLSHRSQLIALALKLGVIAIDDIPLPNVTIATAEPVCSPA